MYKVLFLIFTFLLNLTPIYANSGYEIAKMLELSPASKVKRQWIRVFSKERKMIEYGIDDLTESEKRVLKEYLLSHAADSNHPEKAGF